MIEESCRECGRIRLLKRPSYTGYCRSCGRKWESFWRSKWRSRMDASSNAYLKKALKLRHAMWRTFAIGQVSKAIKDGSLARLSIAHVACDDCGGKATCWEHRDYGRPLDVVPCCHSCNLRRGKAATPWHFPISTARLRKMAWSLHLQKLKEMSEDNQSATGLSI